MKHINTLKATLFSAFILSSGIATAQMDSCNIFMQGKYLEIGINPAGTLGSSVQQPAGYHGNEVAQGAIQFPCSYDGSTTRLGIVSDPAMDNWAHYCGDFITPGYNIYGFNAPYESYILSIADSAFCNNSSLGGLTINPYPGTNVSYSATGGLLTSTYTNLFDSVMITQVTSFDTASLYFSMNVTLTNISAEAKDDIIYIRTMAAMNDYVPAASYNVRTTIEYNRPTDPYSLVSARGIVDTSAYIALGTADTNSKCFMYSDYPLPLLFYPGDTAPHTPTDLYHGAYNYPTYYSGTDTNYYNIGLAFSIPHLAPADSATDSVGRTTAMHAANSQTLHLFYSTSSGANRSALGITPTAVANVNSADIRVYPNPAHTQLTTQGLLKTDHVRFIDCMGREMNGAWPLTNDGTNVLSVTDLPTGYYVMVVSDLTGNVKAKMPIQKN